MAQKDYQNTSSIDTIVSSKPALITDLNPSYYDKDQYSYARNAVRNSREGDLGTIGNEPSNEYCFSAPYKIVGHVDLSDDKILVMSTDEENSEIGIGDLKTCTYTTLRNLQCFNFSKDYPVTGVSKKDFQKGEIATITDKRNPFRRFELNQLSKIKSCDEILLFKKLKQPCISVKKGNIGNIPKGMYSVTVAYSVNGNVLSDWYSISNRIELSSDFGNSLDITVDGLDTSFKEYTVAVVGNYVDPTTKGATKSAKIIGSYSTKVNRINLSDFINNTYPEIKLSELVLKKRAWLKGGVIASNSNYLMLADLVGRKEENYQLKAMQIEAEYVVKQVPYDYYEKGGEDVGFYRDENYDFSIHGVYSSGEITDKWHIPGIKADSSIRAIGVSADVYEFDTQFDDCDIPEKVERWQYQNTASEMTHYNDEFKCNQRILGFGKMGYFESTDLLPDNKDMFGDDANTPIRYHKMPDECKVPRMSEINGKKYINILGVRFKNIPKFDDPDIVGYVITRSDRKGGNGTVIARGLMTNTRFYEDKQTKERILFSNYPVNDLSPDKFLSSTQTQFKNGTEHDFTPINGVYNDKFNFYSPHTSFEPRYTLGTEIKIESEEIADVTGQFEIVYNHPKAKLMNQFAFWVSAAVGFIESSLIILGKNDHKQEKTIEKTVEAEGGIPPSVKTTITTINLSGQEYKISTVADLINLDIVGFIKSKVLAGDLSAFTVIKNVLLAIGSLGLKAAYAVLGGIIEADKTFQSIYDFTGFTDYVYQYNAHAEFNRSRCIGDGNKRRRLLRPATYLPSDVVSVNDGTYNNYFREKSVLLELNRPISSTGTKDNSRNTISGFGICDDVTRKVSSTGSAFYVTSKIPNPNQYGKLGSSSPVSMHSCPIPVSQDETPILFGGDCIITRFQFQKRMQFFNQNLANTNYSDGVEYDYRMYRNIAYPRYWMDTTKYDFSELLSGSVVNYTRFTRTTSNKHNLDCKKGRDGKSISRIDDAYMYLSNNSVLDFFVEADYNVSLREKTEKPFYSKENTNLSQIFRSDRLSFPEEFVINRAFFDIYTTEIFALQQREDFDPKNPVPVEQSNSVIYSLPSFNLQDQDNWQFFLPNNMFSFKESDFGRLTGIHKLDQDRIIFLFSKSSPYISDGRDVLQLEGSGRKITIGDGGLFAHDPREVLPTDNNYGACNSRYAFSNTHLGRYYPSERQGRFLQFTDRIDDVSRQGMSYWCKNYMPIFLYTYFPDYNLEENPVGGVGYITSFDSYYETVYVTKRDFSPKYPDIVYDKDTKSFLYQGSKIDLRDSQYFNDISWTLSYSPIDKSFVSWHDWHPDWIIQTDNHFMTVKDNSIWKHNERYDSFCNFYNNDYPFEIEFISNNGQNVETIRSLEYLLEVYKYKNFGRNRFHVHHENFDRLLVKNSEQISPLLNLFYANPNPEENLEYPKRNTVNSVSWDIAFFKEENKYRINQFWDATRDRGEFSKKDNHLFSTDESGYKSVVNPRAIDINMPEEDRKKFRHYSNQFRLSKTVCGEYKFITKLFNIKKLNSPR